MSTIYSECLMTDGTHEQARPGSDLCPPCEQHRASMEVGDELAALDVLMTHLPRLFNQANGLGHTREAQLVQTHINEAYKAARLISRDETHEADLPAPLAGVVNRSPWEQLVELPVYAKVVVTILDPDGSIIDTAAYGRDRTGIVRSPAYGGERRITLTDAGTEYFATPANLASVRVASYEG